LLIAAKRGNMKPKRPENETPEQRFKRVAEARTKAVLDKLRLLGNCNNKRLYSYSEEDINKIFSTINKRIREVRSRFETHIEEEFEL
jgi:hypothetical protein